MFNQELQKTAFSSVETDKKTASMTLEFSDFIKATAPIPGNTLIAGQAGSGKTVYSRAYSMFLAVLLMTDDKVKAPCDIIHAQRDKSRSKIRAAQYKSILSFSKLLRNLDDSNSEISLLETVLKAHVEPKEIELAKSIGSDPDIAFLDHLSKRDITDEQFSAVCNVGKAMRKVVGPLSNIRNEMGPTDSGMTFQLLDAHSSDGTLSYEISSVEHQFDGAVVSISPLNLVLALMFYSVVRVATVNSAFSESISYGSTLKGGLDEGLLLAIQIISDLAAQSYGRVVMETRDDHSTSSNYYDQSTTTLSAEKQRFMGVSRVAFYLKELNKSSGVISAVFRIRSFTGQGTEVQLDDVSYAGEDYPVALNGGRLEIPSVLQPYAKETHIADIQKTSSGISEADIGLRSS